MTQAPTQHSSTPSTPAPEGRKLLRLEVRNAQTPIEKKPEWIKTRAKMGPQYRELQNLVKGEGLHTVCQEAGCPNIFECWEDREATFLIGGDQCTRRCDFCQWAENDRDDAWERGVDIDEYVARVAGARAELRSSWRPLAVGFAALERDPVPAW